MSDGTSLRDALLRHAHKKSKSESSSPTDGRKAKRKAAPTSPTLADTTSFDLFVPPGAPWMAVTEQQSYVIDAQSMLGYEIFNVTDFLKADTVDKRRRELVVQCLRLCIVDLVKGCIVHVVGSSATPFVMMHNDLNLCVELEVPDDIQMGRNKKQIANYFLKRIAQELANSEIPGTVIHYEFLQIEKKWGLYDITIVFNQDHHIKNATSLALLAGISRFHTPTIMIVKQLLAEHGLDNANMKTRCAPVKPALARGIT